MRREDGEKFRIRTRGSRSDRPRTSPFIKQVLKATRKASATRSLKSLLSGSSRSSRKRPGSRYGRGHVAASMAGERLGARSRRVIVKTRLVVFKHASPNTTAIHLRYIQRDGVSREGGRGELYGPETDQADARAFEEKGRKDRHQFRFIVSPEDATELEDLRAFTRDLMKDVARDLGTRLQWVAVDHWDTDNPHTHIVVRGKDDTGGDLIISGEYIAKGLRARAAELATEWLGERTERQIRQGISREVEQERWTSLDRAIHRKLDDGILDLREGDRTVDAQRERALLSARLERLSRMGLAKEGSRGVWSVSADAESTLRRLGERGDIIRTMQRTFREERREFSIYDASGSARPITGRIAGKGLADELQDRGYLIVDATDGRAHYIALAPKVDLGDLPLGAVVTVRAASEPRVADRNIAKVAQDGIYMTQQHLEHVRAAAPDRYDAAEYVQAHVRRLEALRRAGIVERIEEGIWRVPTDLIERGQAYDRSRAQGATAEVRSYLPIEKQTRAIGATWLDREITRGEGGLGVSGFGAEVRGALEKRAEFLIEQGLARPQDGRTILARNFLAVLRERELESAAGSITKETGLDYRPAIDGTRESGVYRGAVTLASGRFAMLDDGHSFTLVPWRPIVEPRRGQSVSALVRGDEISWEFGRQRGLSR
jgi:type IV secretory pathway VirD2 relaxase